MDAVHELVEADGGNGGRNHHHAQNEREEGSLQLPLIGHQCIGGEGGEVNRQERGAGGDDEGILQTGNGAEHFCPVQNADVVHQAAAKEEGNGVILNLNGASGGVHQHDHKGEQAEDRK